MRNRILLYLAMALLTAIIFVTAGLVDGARKFLVERFGAGVYNVAFIPAALFAIVVFSGVVKSGRAVGIRLTLLVLLGTVLGIQMSSLPFAVEKVHYLEYGLFAVLAAAAFTIDLGASASLALSLILAYGVGLSDEALQSLHPERVADFADVVLNVKAALFGTAFFGVWRFPALRGFRPSPRDLMILLIALLFGLAAAFCFVERVHGYGYRIRDAQGLSFYSSFDPDGLGRADLLFAVGADRGSAGQRTYAGEASRHYFQREFYRTNRFKYGVKSWYIDYGKAFRENGILENHYPAWLDAEGKRWDDAIRADIEHRSRSFQDPAWESRVKSRIIVSATAGRVRMGFAAGGVLLLAGLGLCLRKTLGSRMLSCPTPIE